jgi:hypothetical protein
MPKLRFLSGHRTVTVQYSAVAAIIGCPRCLHGYCALNPTDCTPMTINQGRNNGSIRILRSAARNMITPKQNVDIGPSADAWCKKSNSCAPSFFDQVLGLTGMHDVAGEQRILEAAAQTTISIRFRRPGRWIRRRTRGNGRRATRSDLRAVFASPSAKIVGEPANRWNTRVDREHEGRA